MIYIATNIDYNYYTTKHKEWINSISKFKTDTCKPLIFAIGFHPLEDIDYIYIDPSKLQHSSNYNLKNRKSFVCLESGEFVKFCNFNDDDVIILTDWDLVQQRAFTEDEINLLSNLKPNEFGMNLDNYNNLKFNEYLNSTEIFDDIDDSWLVYNTGVQVGKFSAWKNIYELWTKHCYNVYDKCFHHASGQLLFNYIIQKENLLKLFPTTFHNAHWFFGNPCNVRNNQLFINDTLVLFNHHKWKYIPNF
jgi:hypothetical protein